MSRYRGSKKKAVPKPLRSAIELLEDRSVPAISLVGVPTWVERGPGPLLHGQTEGFLDAPVSGAIRAIAPDPTDANTVLVGSVNGGIWRTTNANLVSPTWTPLIDDFPGLSIGAITFSPRDHNTIFAGVAHFSSEGLEGGSLTGLLKSTDGGDTWSLVGRQLRGLNVRQVVASAADGPEIVLAATDDGLFRSTNGGSTFTSVLGGSFTDLARDTGNVTRFYAARVNSGGGNGGVFRSEDGGATWTRIDIGSMGAGTAINIRLAIHRQAGAVDPLYAGIVGTNGQLRGVFRTGDRGEDWTAAPLPGTTESGSFVGIHPGGQGGIHFSLAADPNDPDVVYVGGDRQPSIGSSVGNVNFTGRLFKGDFTPGFLAPFWESITHLGASLTAPHADSRAMAFDANGSLLEGDDGGIFKLIHPEGSINPFDLRRWRPLNGNLRITELNSVAFDPVNNVIMAGTQDNGSIEMVDGIGSNTWTLVPLIDIFGAAIGLVGDGQAPAVDTVSAAPNVIRYSLGNNLDAFIRRTFDPAGNQVGITVPVLLAAAATSIIPHSGLLAPDDTQGTSGFETGIRYVLNSVNPARMLLGLNNLYESTNRGDTITPVQLIGGQSPVSALAYGGRNPDGTTNVNVAYVARGGTLSLRTAAGTAFTNVLSLTSTIIDIVLDPTNFRTAYLLTRNGRIFRVDNVGLTNQTSTEIASKLRSFEGVDDLQTIEVFRSASGQRVVLAGGREGVYRTIDSDTQGTAASWHEFGAGLPNAPVTDIEFDPTDNRLIVSTLGRGAWTINNASTALVTEAVLTITGESSFFSQDDAIRLTRDADKPWMLDVFLNNTTATPNLAVRLSTLQRIVVSGLAGDDTLTVDSSRGPIAVPGGIEYDGGGDLLGSDSLILTGGSAFTDLYEALPGNAGRSSIQFDTDSDFDGENTLVNQKVNVLGVDLVRDQLALTGDGAFFDVDYTALNQSDTLTLQDDGTNFVRVTSTRTAPIQSLFKQRMHLSAGNQDDRINIVNTRNPFLLESVTVNAGGGNDTVNVESTFFDTTINGEGGNDTVNVGREFGTLLRLVTLNDINNPLTFRGGTGTDTINVNHTEIVDTSGTMDRTFNPLLLVNQTRVTGLGMTGQIVYDDVQNANFNLGFANETMNVVSTIAGVNTNLFMSGGNDTVRLGGSTVNDIRGPLTIDGGSQTGDLVLLQENEPAGVTNVGTIGNPVNAAPGVGFLSGFGMGVAVNFANTETVLISEGFSNDSVNVSFGTLPPTFAFNFFLDGGTDGVVFRGTDKNDHIRVSRRVGPDGPEVIADINGQVISGGYSGGETVSVFAGDGNDQVEIDPSVTTWTAELYGEDGNDHLVGSSQADRLDGGRGNDHLDGLGGDDVLVGGFGQDVLDGGDGTDQIDAGDGDKDVIFADLADVLVSIDANDVVKRR